MQYTSFFRFLFVAIFALTLTACDSGGDGDGGDSGLDSAGTLKATVAGQSFDAVLVVTTWQNGVLSITGNLGATQAGSNEQLSITLNAASVGSHSFGIGGAIGVWATGSLTALDGYTALSGTLNITTLSNNRAVGTFSFTGRNNNGDQIQVSNGEFDVEL